MFIGTIIYGFCGGWFGRESYQDKRIEAIGADWVVAREIYSGMPFFARFDEEKDICMKELIQEWSEKPEDYE